MPDPGMSTMTRTRYAERSVAVVVVVECVWLLGVLALLSMGPAIDDPEDPGGAGPLLFLVGLVLCFALGAIAAGTMLSRRASGKAKRVALLAAAGLNALLAWASFAAVVAEPDMGFWWATGIGSTTVAVLAAIEVAKRRGIP